jgi:hypothetical protein
MVGISSFLGMSQTVDLKGQIEASSELEGIHILNISAEKYTITDSTGAFEILVRVKDTILFSSVQYIPKTIVVTPQMITNKFTIVKLEDRVNELDEIIVGKVLTGDLSSDIQNSDAKAHINFYDVGIPGYTGKPKTQKERRLLEADGGKFIETGGIIPLFGLGLSINVHKILNRISGRTKTLKNLVRSEQENLCMNKAIAEFSDELFGHLELEDHLKMEFFYYASEDPKFLEVCELENDFELYQFLIDKLLAFNIQVESDKD